MCFQYQRHGDVPPPPSRHCVTCVQVVEADLSLSCLAGWGISRALPSRFSPRLCWKWPGKWRPVPPACPHLQPPTCEETHLLWGPVKQPEQGCPAQATVCKPRAAPEQVPWSLRGGDRFGLKGGIRAEYPLYWCSPTVPNTLCHMTFKLQWYTVNLWFHMV